MPITKTTGFKDSAGVVHATVEEAKAHELMALARRSECCKEAPVEDMASFIMDNADDILSILTTGPTSRPGARKHPGTSSPARINLQLTLDHLRKQYDLTDAEIIQRVQDKSILKFKSIGEAKFASLQKWAQQKGLNQHKATEAQVASGIKAMREAVEAAPQAAEQAA